MPPTPPKPSNQRWQQTEIRGVQAVHHETGELIDLGTVTGLTAMAPRRTKNRKEIKFMLVDIDAMPKLSMSKGQWKLFWQVISHTDREHGEARVSTAELAVALGWLPANTSRALTELRGRGILVKERPGVWRVSPLLMSRKAVDKWELDMRSAPKIDWDGE